MHYLTKQLDLVVLVVRHPLRHHSRKQGVEFAKLECPEDHIGLFKDLVVGQLSDAQHRSLDAIVDRMHVLVDGRRDVLSGSRRGLTTREVS